MKKILKMAALAVVGATSIIGLASCNQEQTGFDTTKEIKRYTRDTSSGTREGFFEKIGYADASKSNSAIPGAIEVGSNGVLLTSVQGDEYGIGYVSLASVTSDVNAIKFEGVEPTEENVNNGTYKLTRNFNYITRTQDDMSDTEKALVKGFLLYMNSKEGLAIIKSNDGIIAADAISNASSFQTLVDLPENSDVKAQCQATTKTTIYFGGSTSVEKIAKSLTEAFSKVCSGFDYSHNHTGSSDAYKRTQGSDKDSQNKLHVGFLSRDIKITGEEPVLENTYGKICVDGIAVIVNKANTSVTNFTAEQLKKIYSTDKIKWNEIA